MNAEPYQSTRSEYLANESEDNKKSPSEKAWDTAKQKAVERATSPFHKQNDEEIRCLCDKNLPAGATRLFGIIAKLSWHPQHGGIFRGRIGSIAISARDLAKLANANVKSFYNHTDKKTGKLKPGWLPLLEQGGYLWVSKHRIRNIPEAKAQNVYNLCCFVARQYTPDLPLLSGQESVPNNGHGENSAFSEGENQESQQMGTGSDPNGALPVTQNGHSPLPQMGTGNDPNGALPMTQNGHGPLPKMGTGRAQNGALPVTQNGHSPLPKNGHGQYGQSGQPIKLQADKAVNGASESPINRLENRAGSPIIENENDFMLACLEVFGEHEMRRAGPKKEGNGGLWRTLYRQNPKKAKAVLLETRSAKLEKRINKTPAKFAMDLWTNDRVGVAA